MRRDAALLAASAVMYGALIGSVLAAHPLAGDVGASIREWGTFVGAAATAAGAIWAAVIASRAYRQSVETARLAAEDRHREHASKLSVWVTAIGAEFGGARTPFLRLVARVRNSSDEPMYRVVVVFRDADEPTRTVQVSGPRHVLPPRETFDVDLAPKGELDAERFVAEAGFDDRAGVHWYRDWRGRLLDQPAHTVPAIGEGSEDEAGG